jgi:hypothetical protein
MDTPDTRLQVIFNVLFKIAVASPLAFPRPPMTKDDFLGYVEYLRALIGHEARTRESCEDAVRELTAGEIIPASIGAWERYFLDLRLQAALTFLGQCGCSGYTSLPVRAVLPGDNKEALRILLSDIWRDNLCGHFLKLASVSAYFGISFEGADNA